MLFKKGAYLIVADPRRTKLADFADIYVPIKVGSDVAFLNGLMHVLITEKLYDEKYVTNCCTGFEALKQKVMEYPPERVAPIVGIAPEMFREVARRMAAIKPMMLIYTLGITEHTCGVNNVLSCANIQMVLGNVGFECGGVNPIRGQNNVQGACDMGALPNVFPGYQKVIDPAARAKFEAFWGVENLPDKNGLMMPQMMDALPTGKIKLFYVFGENLANTEPDIHHVEKKSGRGRIHGLPRHLPHRNHPLCRRHLSGGSLVRRRGHFCQQRTAGQSGPQGETGPGPGQAQLVDFQRAG